MITTWLLWLLCSGSHAAAQTTATLRTSERSAVFVEPLDARDAAWIEGAIVALAPCDRLAARAEHAQATLTIDADDAGAVTEVTLDPMPTETSAPAVRRFWRCILASARRIHPVTGAVGRHRLSVAAGIEITRARQSGTPCALEVELRALRARESSDELTVLMAELVAASERIAECARHAPNGAPTRGDVHLAATFTVLVEAQRGRARAPYSATSPETTSLEDCAREALANLDVALSQSPEDASPRLLHVLARFDARTARRPCVPPRARAPRRNAR